MSSVEVKQKVAKTATTMFFLVNMISPPHFSTRIQKRISLKRLLGFVKEDSEENKLTKHAMHTEQNILLIDSSTRHKSEYSGIK